MSYTSEYTEPDGTRMTVETDHESVTLVRCPYCQYVSGFLTEAPEVHDVEFQLNEVQEVEFQLGEKAMMTFGFYGLEGTIICMRCKGEFLIRSAPREILKKLEQRSS